MSRLLILPVFVLAAYSQAHNMLAQHSRNNPYSGLKVALSFLAAFSLSCYSSLPFSGQMKLARNELIVTSSGLSAYSCLVVSPSFRTRRCSRRLCRCCRTARPKLTSFACRSARPCRPLSTATTHRVSVTPPLDATCAQCDVTLVTMSEQLRDVGAAAFLFALGAVGMK